MRRGVWQWFRFTLFEPKQFAGTVSALLLALTLVAVVAGYPVRITAWRPGVTATQQPIANPIGRGPRPSDGLAVPANSSPASRARPAAVHSPSAGGQADALPVTASQASGVAGSEHIQSRPAPRQSPKPTPTPTPSARSSAPLAVLTADASGLTVTASGAASSSPVGAAIVSYMFDFGDGAVLGPQAIDVVTHQYSAAGTYKVTLTVRDARGRTGTDSVRVEVS